MTTVQVQVQLSPEDLLAAVNQLSLSNLNEFANQVIALRAQRTAPVLSKDESELMLNINQSLSEETWKRYHELIEKRQDETLTQEEHRQLLDLTEQVRKSDKTSSDP